MEGAGRWGKRYDATMSRRCEIALTVCALSVGGGVGGAWLGGCSSGPKPDLESPVPSARIEAMGAASRRHDPKEISELIALLESDDPAVRVFAIASLDKITGERLGYDPADPERIRREAVDRWEAWYREEYGVGGGNDRWKEGGVTAGGRGGGAAGGNGGGGGGETDHRP